MNFCFLGVHSWRYSQDCNGMTHKFYRWCKRCGVSRLSGSRRCGKACEVYDSALDTQEKLTRKFLEEEARL
jgi:hypothetical protein